LVIGGQLFEFLNNPWFQLLKKLEIKKIWFQCFSKSQQVSLKELAVL
jgi:hypothetical protein